MQNNMLDAIETLFFENSFSDLSMENIAKALWMKKASLYYHFPSKEAMFLAVVKNSYDKYQSRVLSLFWEFPTDIISEFVSLGVGEKNLFAIVSQKWYCKVPAIKEAIQAYSGVLRNEIVAQLGEKWWKRERAQLFLILLDAISKEYCLMGCEKPIDSELIEEIHNLFIP